MKEDICYLFITGGVMSGIGKGVTTSALGSVLSDLGYDINIMKIDPYLNVDAGTMHPTEHGETFVLNGGLETDQDMGNYERFLDKNLSEGDYLTSGMVYQSVIQKEREGGYKGKCVEAIPNVVDAIQDTIESSAKKSKADIQIIEIGGTLGDYQNLLFLEAARRMQLQHGTRVAFGIVAYLPFLKTVGESKTRPAQNAIRQLNSYGIHPDLLFLRSEGSIDTKRKKKLSDSSNIPLKRTISMPDIDSIYQLPTILYKERMGELVRDLLDLKKRPRNKTIKKWDRFVRTLKDKKLPKLKVAIAGKYFKSGKETITDSYISIIEGLKFSSVSEKVNVEIHWLDSNSFTKIRAKEERILKQFNALIIPGGFGSNGVEGKLQLLKWARKHKVPTLGICYGMQLMIVEFMRNVIGKKRAHTIEIDPKTPDPVITILEDQKDKLSKKQFGGSMRLGGYAMKFIDGSWLKELYKANKAIERHRHRYEVNPDYVQVLEENGMFGVAFSKGDLCEAIELDEDLHPFYVGVQYHPEFTARPFSPNPVFNGLLKVAKSKKLKGVKALRKSGSKRK